MSVLSEAPAGAAVLDLGAARVARAEVRAAAGAGNPVIKLAVGFVELQAEFPVASAEAFEAGRISEGLGGLLVDREDAAVLLAEGLSAQDLRAIAEFIAGASLGE